jgi:glycosyltransferase involved in cell wall biosynthesis
MKWQRHHKECQPKKEEYAMNKVQPTVLVSAYAVNPYHGSEDGMGWNFILQIARFNKVIAVTRENTKTDIEKYMSENPSKDYSNIQFAYYDLPYWARFWKKGGRGAMLYYYLWQFFLPRFVNKNKYEFDIVHNLNFHNDWTPSSLWKLHKPFVWGPIGHHPRIPKDYVLHVYGWKSYLMEEVKWMVKKYFWKMDPLLRQTISHADCVLTMNSGVERVLDLPKEKIYYMPSVSTEAPTEVVDVKRNGNFTVLSAGRFVPLKGFDITIRAFARFYHQLSFADQKTTKLVLVGDGPYKKYLQNLAKEMEVQDQVTFIAWLHRSDYKKLYKKSDVFLFPSHEGAGMVVAEALSYGLPVVCFKNEGPGEFVSKDCGIAVPYNRYNTSVTKFAEALRLLKDDQNLYLDLSNGAKKRFQEKFNWNLKGDQLKEVYSDLTRIAG